MINSGFLINHERGGVTAVEYHYSSALVYHPSISLMSVIP